MTIPHEILVWNLEAPVICMGVDFDFEVNQPLSGSFVCIDESYEPDRRRVHTF